MTNDEWNRLKPFAMAKVAADQAMLTWNVRSAPSDMRERAEDTLLGMRLRIEQQQATDAYEAAIRRLAPTVEVANVVQVHRGNIHVGDNGSSE
jgi:hypothetical protein